jgi:hypothetical protein
VHIRFAELLLWHHQNLFGLEPVKAKAFTDWAGGAHVIVLDEKSFHGKPN